jgi:TPR repeat protein
MEGDPIAQDILGDCYADGDGITQDPREAMSWYRKSAAQGLPFAQFDLGERLSHGQGEEQAQEVFTWYKKAADKEYPVAQLHLAALYVDGKGTTKDPDKALQMLRKSAEHGYAESQCELANLYSFEQRDDLFHARTVPSFLRANRDPSISKESRIDFDLKQAVEWYRKAASRGNLEAKFELFKLFRQGEGVARDLKEALKLVTEAANGGNSRAQMSLGRLYEQGEMVEQNKGEALKWYSKALDSDDGKFLEEFKRKVERRIDDIDPQEGNRRSQRKLEKQLSEIEAKSKEVAAKSLDEHSGKFGGPSTEQVMISIGGASFGDNKVTVRRGEVLISTGGKAPVGTKLFPVRVSSEVNGLNVSLTFRFWKDAFGDWKFEKVNN